MEVCKRILVQGGLSMMPPKTLSISCAVSNFYGTEIKMWASFGPVGYTEKKIMSNF